MTPWSVSWQLLTRDTLAVSKDMTAPNWARTVRRLRKMIEELRSYDCEVREPDSFETPPSRRFAAGGIVNGGVLYLVGEHGPEGLVPKDDPQL